MWTGMKFGDEDEDESEDEVDIDAWRGSCTGRSAGVQEYRGGRMWMGM